MITVVSPGARTLVQDAGRPGYEHLGVPTSGAADLPALRLANMLVANPATAPAFEIAAAGPTLLFDHDTTIAYTGAEADLHLDERAVPCDHTITVRAGQRLTIGSLYGGLYGYLSVAGGLDVPRTLGSASTCTLSGLGPAPVRTGDTFQVLPGAGIVESGFVLPDRSRGDLAVVRYLPGPHSDLFTAQARAAFAHTVWRVSPASSRVGVRLDGTALEAPSQSLPSLGMVTGAIQVPPSGSPIVLGPDHGTVGGYPVIGVVVPADLPVLMQQVSGTALTLVPVAHGSQASAPQARVVQAQALTA